MGPEILAALLGIPVSWFAGLTLDKIKTFVSSLQDVSLEGLFIKTFYKSLDAHKKEFPEGVKKLKKSIKEKEEEFIEIFSLNIGDYNSLISALKEENFHDTVARQVVEHFGVEKNFREVMVIIVRSCLTNYRAIFLKTISEKQKLQMILLLQGQNLDVTLNSIQEMGKTIIAEFKKAIKQEAVPGAEIIEPKTPPVKQIKILSITASPEDELQYEKEQDTLLQAFKDFDRERVFLDIPDPVQDTLTEIAEHLQDGQHDILHITAHGSLANKKGEGILFFETEAGKAIPVTGAELAKALLPAPKIVILCACHSANKKPELMPVAEALRRAGIDSVIGMKKAISHDAAIEFNRGFLTALCREKTLKEAFEAGKGAIFKLEEQRLRRGQQEAPQEYEIPQLLTGDENLTAESFSGHRIEAPGRPQSHQFMGAKYLERGFIGRRQILRRIYKSIRKGMGAVVLKGPGGIGKSTLTTRVTANLYHQGEYDFIVVQGATSVEQIIEALSQKAAQKGIAGAAEVFAADAEEKVKLGWYLENYLLKNKVVIIFDNFEENQDEARDGDFANEPLKKFLWFFRDSLNNSDSFLFFSTRYTLPGFDDPGTCREIGEFSPVEFRKMLLHRDALKNLDPESAASLRQQVGGNPRALDLLDKIAFQEFEGREFSWPELAELIPGLKERIIEKEGSGDDFTPLFLDRLFAYLCKTRRKLLNVLAVFRAPVPKEALAAFDMVLDREDHLKLTNLSLLERTPGDRKSLYYIHRLTAQHLLSQVDQPTQEDYHHKAARYFAAIRGEEGAKYLENDIEARRHFLRAGMWNEGADITFNLMEYLHLHGYPQRALELLRELDLTKLSDEAQAVAHNRFGILHQDFGKYDLALDSFNKSLKIDKQRKDDKGTAVNLHQIGIIYQEKGQYEEALSRYQQSLQIREKIGDTKGIAESLHQIGMIYEEKGQYEEALENYEKCREIFADMGTQKELAAALHQIGIIYQEKGQYDEALERYQQSLEIEEKLGNQKGISQSLHQIGRIYEEKGQYEEALSRYQQSLEIKEKIGDTSGIATTLHQIGIIYELKGQYEEALNRYQQSFEIRERIGDIAGMAISLGQMGQLYFKKEEFETALKCFIRAFIIFTKLEAPYANLAKRDIGRVREKLPPERFAEILAEMGIKIDDGEGG